LTVLGCVGTYDESVITAFDILVDVSMLPGSSPTGCLAKWFAG